MSCQLQRIFSGVIRAHKVCLSTLQPAHLSPFQMDPSEQPVDRPINQQLCGHPEHWWHERAYKQGLSVQWNNDYRLRECMDG